jgi:hypothetical protein
MVENFSSTIRMNGHHNTMVITITLLIFLTGSSRKFQELTYYFPFFSLSYSMMQRADAKAAVLP